MHGHTCGCHRDRWMRCTDGGVDWLSLLWVDSVVNKYGVTWSAWQWGFIWRVYNGSCHELEFQFVIERVRKLRYLQTLFCIFLIITHCDCDCRMKAVHNWIPRIKRNSNEQREREIGWIDMLRNDVVMECLTDCWIVIGWLIDKSSFIFYKRSNVFFKCFVFVFLLLLNKYEPKIQKRLNYIC